MTDIIQIQKEINAQIANKEVLTALLNTTFKGLEAQVMKRAMMEGMMRGFKFQDFLEKNIYAIPFRDTYSLVTSIDYARKIGMRNGVCGKSAPTYTLKEGGNVESCTITVKRKVADYIGEYTATVFFDEFNTGRNLWQTKPRAMIAKVAEMHALRMACPEELSQSYIEDEVEKESRPEVPVEEVDLNPYKVKLEAVKDLQELQSVWSSLPIQAKQALEELKNNLKAKYAAV